MNRSLPLAAALLAAAVPAAAATFSDGELCRAAHATRIGRHPVVYETNFIRGREVHISYLRPSDRRVFEYWCQVGDRDIRTGDANLGWHENSRVTYDVFATTVTISYWSTPKGSRQSPEILDVQVFDKPALAEFSYDHD